jgi:CheY-like chemotaxis protein
MKKGDPAEEQRLPRILIVDDNRDSADGLAMMLEGREVKVAYDGISALEQIEEYNPKIVLLDIGMPGMDGYGRVAAEPLRPRKSVGPERCGVVAFLHVESSLHGAKGGRTA